MRSDDDLCCGGIELHGISRKREKGCSRTHLATLPHYHLDSEQLCPKIGLGPFLSFRHSAVTVGLSVFPSCRMTTRSVPSVSFGYWLPATWRLLLLLLLRRYCSCCSALVAAMDGSCRIDDERVNGMNESSLRGSVNWNGIGSDRD